MWAKAEDGRFVNLGPGCIISRDEDELIATLPNGVNLTLVTGSTAHVAEAEVHLHAALEDPDVALFDATMDFEAITPSDPDIEA